MRINELFQQMPSKKQVRFSDSNIIIDDSRKNLRDITNSSSNLSILPTSNHKRAQERKKDLLAPNLAFIAPYEDFSINRNQFQVISESKEQEDDPKFQAENSQEIRSNASKYKSSSKIKSKKMFSENKNDPLPVNDHIPDHFECIFEKKI